MVDKTGVPGENPSICRKSLTYFTISDPLIPVLHNPSISKIGLKFKDVDSVKKSVAVSISGCLVKVKQK